MGKAKVDREALEKLRRHFAGESEALPDADRPTVEAPRDASIDEADFLRNLSLRCTAKAAAIRRATASTADGAPELGEACNFWMQPYLSRSGLDPQDWIVLAGNYEVLSSVADQWSHLVGNQVLGRYRKEGFVLAAEAQSALREAVQRIRPAPDDDQAAIFRWLRQRSQEEQVRIDRYMRSTDVAPSADWSERLERVTAWRTTIQNARTSERQKRKLTGKLRYQIGQVPKGAIEEWARVLETIDLLIDLGVPPSHRGLRDILWPQRERLLAEPDHGGSRNVALVARELARAQQSLEAAPITADTENERDEALIRQAADLLRGTVVVFIGGDERPPVAQAIVDAFELRELVWCDTRPHKSHFPLEPAIARTDVSVVLLAIRWASHGLGEVRAFSERYGKAFVRLPAGYSVNQLAFQILQQASGRLQG